MHGQLTQWKGRSRYPSCRPSACPLGLCFSRNLHAFTCQFIALHRRCAFYHLQVRGNPLLRRSFGAIFLTPFPHFVSLCHIWIVLTIFKHFHYSYMCMVTANQ